MTDLRSQPPLDRAEARHVDERAVTMPEQLLRLHRLVYVSRSTGSRARARADAISIAEHARPANLRQGLTGALVCGAGIFGQVLEGPLGPLATLFDRILADPRHHDVRLLTLEPTPQRRFSGWGMVFAGELPGRLLRAAWASYARQERQGDAAATAQASATLSQAIEDLARSAATDGPPVARAAPRPGPPGAWAPTA